MTTGDRPPHATRLAQARAARDLSLAEVASRLRELARDLGEVDPGLTARTVWAWEQQGRRPSRHYRRLLCRFYDQTPDQLGLSGPRHSGQAANRERVTAWVHDARTQGALSPFPWGSPEVVAEPSSSADVDPELVPYWLELRGVLTSQDELFGARRVLDVACRSLRLIGRQRDAARGHLRVDLMRVEARWAMLVAWLRDDLGDREAAPLMDRALSLSGESDDQLMAGYVLARQAERAARFSRPDEAIGLARAARQQRGLTPQVLALSVLYEALGHAQAGDATVCERQIEHAHELVEHADAAIDPGWDGLGRHYATRATVLASEARCWRWLDQPHRAVETADEALTSWPDTRRRGGGLQRAGLAVACAQAGDLDRAADEGLRALEVARETHSTRTMQELRRLDHRLASRDAQTETAREFREALASAAA